MYWLAGTGTSSPPVPRPVARTGPRWAGRGSPAPRSPSPRTSATASTSSRSIAAARRRDPGTARSGFPPTTRRARTFPASISSTSAAVGRSPKRPSRPGRLGGPASAAGDPGTRRGRRKPGLNHTPPGAVERARDGQQGPRHPLRHVAVASHRRARAGLDGDPAGAAHRGDEVIEGADRTRRRSWRPDSPIERRRRPRRSASHPTGVRGRRRPRSCTMLPGASRTTCPRTAQSVPGRGWRCRSATAAVSVRRTSMHHRPAPVRQGPQRVHRVGPRVHVTMGHRRVGPDEDREPRAVRGRPAAAR